MLIALPTPIAEYFAAEQAGDAARLARCFITDGVIRAEGGMFAGTAAIEQWNAAARATYHYTVAPISSTVRDGATVVAGRVAGNFPNSPIELDYVFRIDGDKIASLEIG